MKKLIASLLLLLAPVAAFAVLEPYSFLIYQTNETSDGYYGRYMVPANVSGTNYWFKYDGASSLPVLSSLSTSDITGLSAALSAKFDAPSGSTGQYVRGDGSLATFPTLSRSFSYTTRSLNTCFQVSSTRDAVVSYAVDIATSLSLTSGQQGTVYLRTYSNSGCSAGTQELTRFVNGQTGTLTVGLALQQNVTATLNGIVPAGKYVQLVTENNTGTPTFTARPGQEVLL